jgi:hypothetical protein
MWMITAQRYLKEIMACEADFDGNIARYGLVQPYKGQSIS